MQYLKAIIVEDESNNAKLLQHFLEKHCPMLITEGIAKNVIEAKELIIAEKPDIVFLDILLDDELVFDLFKNKEELPNFQIIFTTAFDEYAIKAFKYNTVDYLLKPIDIGELKKAVDRAIKNHNKELKTSNQTIKSIEEAIKNKQSYNSKIIAIASQKEVLLINEDDIISCSSHGKYTSFQLISGDEIVSSKNIGEYEKLLTPLKFFRIHHSHIINLNHLVKIDKRKDNYCELSNGKLLPLSKRRSSELRKFLNF